MGKKFNIKPVNTIFFLASLIFFELIEIVKLEESESLECLLFSRADITFSISSLKEKLI